MKEFFRVTSLEKVLEYRRLFPVIETETICLADTNRRILGVDIVSDVDLPDFSRSTMDGYAVAAASTFGASEENPAYLLVKGAISMGKPPGFSIGQGEAAKISTGGMLPRGADSVVMIEHTQALDDTAIEVYRSVAPGHNIVEAGEDYRKGDIILAKGQRIRPQETGLLAAFGKESVPVYRMPVVGIISTGDEIVDINQTPGPNQVRDINTYTLSGLVIEAGGIPIVSGIIGDNYDALFKTCSRIIKDSDIVLISGGSSVGTRDHTIDVLSSLEKSEILVHGISISPGKPTILAKIGNKAFWGLPGHVVSAMIVFLIVVKPFIEHLAGISDKPAAPKIMAMLRRNVSSAQGRTEFIRVRLIEKDGTLWADPILGKSGLINTMVKADGLIEIDINTEGLDKGTQVPVMLF